MPRCDKYEDLPAAECPIRAMRGGIKCVSDSLNCQAPRSKSDTLPFGSHHNMAETCVWAISRLEDFLQHVLESLAINSVRLKELPNDDIVAAEQGKNKMFCANPVVPQESSDDVVIRKLFQTDRIDCKR